ncbi:Helix-turn-helix domain protein [compost metagenome]
MLKTYSKNELARALRVSPRTIVRWIIQRGLPVEKQEIFPGKQKRLWQYVFDHEKVMTWLKQYQGNE